MKPEILHNIPESGSIDEVRFDASGTCTWVKFFDSECREWVGVFGQGVGGRELALQGTNGVVLVLSKGQGYVIDINSRTLLHKTECDYLGKALVCSDSSIFAAATDTDIRIYSSTGLILSTERIASDGINFDSFTNHVLKGEVWGFDRWYRFILNAENHTYECNWSCPL